MEFKVSSKAHITISNKIFTTNEIITTIHPLLDAHKKAFTLSDGFIEFNDNNLDYDGKVGKDREINYYIELFNRSSLSFNNILIEDNINLSSNSFTIINSNLDYKSENSKIKFFIPYLSPNSKKTIQYTIKLNDSLKFLTKIKTQAFINYNENPKKESLDSKPIIINLSYSEVKAYSFAPESILLNEPFDYVFTFKSIGSEPTRVKNISNKLPKEFNINTVDVYLSTPPPYNTYEKKIQNSDYVISINTDKKDKFLVIKNINNSLNIPPYYTLKVIANGSIS